MNEKMDIQNKINNLMCDNIRNIRSKRMNEGNVLFNDALNTFYFRLYGVGGMNE